jgi:uncharacterized protein YcgI (DUF1989 family)
MSDNKDIQGTQDDCWVDPQDYLEMRNEADALGVSQTQLKDAINHVGHSRKGIEEYLRRNK